MKMCTRCNETKSLDEFGIRNRQTGTRQPWCRPCKRAYDRTAYRSQEDRVSRVKERRRKQVPLLGQYVLEHLRANPCVDCGEEDLVVLEFDHVRGTKLMAVSKMVQQGVALETLKVEIAKCDIRCCNCHRRRTHIQLGWRQLWDVV